VHSRRSSGVEVAGRAAPVVARKPMTDIARMANPAGVVPRALARGVRLGESPSRRSGRKLGRKAVFPRSKSGGSKTDAQRRSTITPRSELLLRSRIGSWPDEREIARLLPARISREPNAETARWNGALTTTFSRFLSSSNHIFDPDSIRPDRDIPPLDLLCCGHRICSRGGSSTLISWRDKQRGRILFFSVQ